MYDKNHIKIYKTFANNAASGYLTATAHPDMIYFEFKYCYFDAVGIVGHAGFALDSELPMKEAQSWC